MLTPKRKLLAQRAIQLATLAFLVLTLSGCVYLRLLKFKNQLKDWEEHVVISDGPGLILEFPKPVLRDSDFTFITESQPTKIHRIDDSLHIELWDWKFKKETRHETAIPFDIIFTTRFENRMLTHIEFDPKLIQAIPEEFIAALFKSMGKAKINKLRRSATAKVDTHTLTDVRLPSINDIESVMGDPTIRENKSKRRSWRYVFNFFNPENEELSGQFQIVFRPEGENLDEAIAGFEVSGKAN